jgi:hypothetical protein
MVSALRASAALDISRCITYRRHPKVSGVDVILIVIFIVFKVSCTWKITGNCLGFYETIAAIFE